MIIYLGYRLKKIVIIAIMGSFLSARAEVWHDTQTWQADTESQYELWVKQNWNKNFFAQRNFADGKLNPFYGLRVDCADTVYSMRAAFSYIHNLPFAINDPTGGSHIISNRMSRFDSVADEAGRLRQFMFFLYNTVSTHSLPQDTFPIALNRQWVKPGALIMTTATNHHSWTVKDILDIGVPWLVFNSRVGAQSSIVVQERISWPNPFWVFEGNSQASGRAGFRYWKPIEMLKNPEWDQVGYSIEQYQIPLAKWVETAQSHLATRNEKIEDTLSRLMENSCQELKARVGVIRDGILYLNSHPNSCMTYEIYDNYSSPSRDQRFFDSLIDLRNTFATNQTSELPEPLHNQLLKIFPHIDKSAKEELALTEPGRAIDESSICLVDYALIDAGRPLDLAEAKRRIFSGLFSNNPHDTLEYRWGEKSGHSALAESCKSWDPWTPQLP